MTCISVARFLFPRGEISPLVKAPGLLFSFFPISMIGRRIFDLFECDLLGLEGFWQWLSMVESRLGLFWVSWWKSAGDGCILLNGRSRVTCFGVRFENAEDYI